MKLSFWPPIQKGKKESVIAGYSCWRASLKNAFARLESFVWFMFLRTWRWTTFNSIPVILIFLTNKNSSLIYSVIICKQKNKGQCTVREFRMIYSYFEKGCRKKCTQQSRKLLWVALRALFFKEIWKNGTGGHGHMLVVLKESNKSRFDSSGRYKQCIDHIPYYLSALSRAHFFRQPFSK